MNSSIEYTRQLGLIEQGERCKALWLAVLDQALCDIRRPEGPTPYLKGASTKRLFVWTNTPEFRAICHCADVNPEAVKAAMNDAYIERRKEGKCRPRRKRNFKG